MNSQELRDRIIEIVKKGMKTKIALRLNEDSNLFEEAGLDSVAILNLISNIEEELGIKIKNYELESDTFSRLGNFIALVEGKVNEAN